MVFVEVFWWFIIYSFIDWVYESILCSITEKKLVNRGFLTGPVCPVYGCGALIIIFCLSGVKDNLLALFLSSVVLTTVLEYITSYLLEKFFHAKWWDYSQYRFNVNGRVCLWGSLIFGLLSVAVIEWAHPFITGLLGKISPIALLWAGGVVFGVFLCDVVLTVRSILTLNGRLQEIQQAINTFKGQLAEASSQKKQEIMERFETSEFNTKHIKALVNRRKFQERRLLKAFPKLTSLRYEEALEKLKSLIYKKK